VILPKTTDDLLNRFRSDTQDILEGVSVDEPDSENLWSNQDLLQYMTEAADAVARDTKSLYKTFELPVVANTATVKLPAQIIEIRLARIPAQNVVLDPLNQNQMAAGYTSDYGNFVHSGVFTSKGRPRWYVHDREPKSLVLMPIPTTDDILELNCVVTINVDLDCGMLLPFRELPDIRLMLAYMKYLAYSKQDADAASQPKAEKFQAYYEQKVSDRESEKRRERRAPTPMRMEW
jgi:hypothetical protein